MRPGVDLLTDEQVAAFVEDGYVRLAGAFSHAVARECRAELWAASGCDPHDRSTWTRPVVRISSLASAPFREAANTPAPREAFDQLVGVGR